MTNKLVIQHVPVAQWIECFLAEEEVRGSNPLRDTIKYSMGTNVLEQTIYEEKKRVSDGHKSNNTIQGLAEFFRIIWEFIKAKKQKICPFIEFE